MAKRKRLTPALLADLDAGLAAPETKSHLPPGLASPAAAPPIARVVADSAAAAALDELAGTLAAARAEGRMVLRLPLEAVVLDHLVRDRIASDDEEMAALMASIAAQGQRTPVDVTEISPGRYGLISGWRRMTALARLHAQTGEARFAEVLALLRRPETAAAAYLAMVEENEIREGLSYYERARIVARAVDLGVFATEKAALQGLFPTASRPRRSKIGSFLSVVRALDPVLRFPATIPERLGLPLARLVETAPGRTATLRERLAAQPARHALDELTLLQEAVEALEAAEAAPPAPEAPGGDAGGRPANVSHAKHPGAAAGEEEVAPGIRLRLSGPARSPAFTLSGPGLGSGFEARLRAWLAGSAGTA